jgi:hypothetical protein
MKIEIDATDDKEKGRVIQQAAVAIHSADASLRNFPGLLKQIIWAKAWERWEVKGRTFELSSLRELITEKPIRGWGEDPKKVEAVIKDDPECLALYREAMKCVNQYDLPSNNVTGQEAKTGNSKAYTCERLKRVAPELFEEVVAGRMSANAAAIQAGIRKKPTPEEQCVKAFRKSQSRLVPLKVIVLDLEPHELSVIADWVKERLDGWRMVSDGGTT